jgi:excisionase family DNA binding protein
MTSATPVAAPVATMAEARYLDVAGLATYITKSPKAIRQMVNKAHIPHIRVGRSVRFDVKQIDAWMQQQVDRRKPQ